MARLRNLLVELYAKVDSREVHRVIREARRFRQVSGERRSLSERRARVGLETKGGNRMWQGLVVSLHIAPAASVKMVTVPEVRAVPGRGLGGDRYFLGTGFYSQRPSQGGREVTLIEIETVDALNRDAQSPAGTEHASKLAAADTRRNIATSGVPLNHLVDRQFWVGSVLMRGVRLCEPCKHLEDLTRTGVMGALVHRGGLRAQILREGVIRAGDIVRAATP